LIAEKEEAMKPVILLFALLLAPLFYSAAALSEERTSGLSDEYGQYENKEMKGQKDECLIVAKNCVFGNETVMQRAERLQREIEKGASVYTPAELKSFQDQLNWIYSESGEFSGKSQ
jgi:hypothetical protein